MDEADIAQDDDELLDEEEIRQRKENMLGELKEQL